MNNPTKLYKFKSFDQLDHIYDILIKETVYFSHVDDFNDPFEFSFRVSFEERIENKLIFIKNDSPELYARLRNLPEDRMKKAVAYIESEYVRQGHHLASNKEKYGVFCLSSCPFNIAHWSYYGNSHNGVCIEFDTRNSLAHIAKVEYLPESDLPILNFYRRKTNTGLPFKAKHISFRNEGEYRCFNESPRKSENLSNIGKVLRIYLGAKVKADTTFKMFIFKLANSCPNLEVILLSISQDSYNLKAGKPITVKELFSQL